MRLRWLSSFLSVALFSASAQIIGTPPLATSSDTTRYSLSGTVVNSVTGEPVRRALVTMMQQRQEVVMTDADGHFSFEGLPRMNATVTAQKPGFFNEQELTQGKWRPSSVVVGTDTSSVTIKLAPEAILFGRITDTDGLPVPGVLVRALTQSVVEGRKEWQQGMIGRTDNEGNFRIVNLRPGSYFLIAGPGRAMALVSGTEDTSELGYPAVTYPSATSPMKISAGQQVEADFTIKPEPFYSVTGSVSGTIPGGHYLVQLQSRTPGTRIPLGASRVDEEAGTFTIPRVAPGEYMLMARGGFRGGNSTEGTQLQAAYGAVPISVHRNLMGVTVALEPTLTIPVNVQMQTTREAQANGRRPKQVPRLQITLRSPDENVPTAFTSFEDPKDPNSQLVVRNALPGKYRVQLLPTFGDTYVASARFGTTDLLDGELNLTESASQGAIDVVIRDDAASLTVKVASQDAGGIASVLIVPDRGEPKLTAVRIGPNENGVPVRGLRPGSYAILAFENIGNLEYMNRAALEPYLSRAVRITLAPNQNATVTPDLIKKDSDQ